AHCGQAPSRARLPETRFAAQIHVRDSIGNLPGRMAPPPSAISSEISSSCRGLEKSRAEPVRNRPKIYERQKIDRPEIAVNRRRPADFSACVQIRAKQPRNLRNFLIVARLSALERRSASVRRVRFRLELHFRKIRLPQELKKAQPFRFLA